MYSGNNNYSISKYHSDSVHPQYFYEEEIRDFFLKKFLNLTVVILPCSKELRPPKSQINFKSFSKYRKHLKKHPSHGINVGKI